MMNDGFKEKDITVFNAVNAMKNGHMEQFTTVYELSYKYLYKIINDIVANPDTTEDLLQETYIKIVEKINTLVEAKAFYVWAGRIATNMAYRYIQANGRVTLVAADEEGNTDYAFEMADSSIWIPEEVVLEKEKRAIIGRIIDGLSPEQKVTVQYFYFEEMSVNQIAAAMGCSTGTVKSRLNYARKAIKDGVLDVEQKSGTKIYSLAGLPLLWIAFREVAEASTAKAAAMSPALLQTANHVAAAGKSYAGVNAGSSYAGQNAGSTYAGQNAGSTYTGQNMGNSYMGTNANSSYAGPNANGAYTNSAYTNNAYTSGSHTRLTNTSGVRASSVAPNSMPTANPTNMVRPAGTPGAGYGVGSTLPQSPNAGAAPNFAGTAARTAAKKGLLSSLGAKIMLAASVIVVVTGVTVGTVVLSNSGKKSDTNSSKKHVSKDYDYDEPGSSNNKPGSSDNKTPSNKTDAIIEKIALQFFSSIKNQNEEEMFALLCPGIVNAAGKDELWSSYDKKRGYNVDIISAEVVEVEYYDDPAYLDQLETMIEKSYGKRPQIEQLSNANTTVKIRVNGVQDTRSMMVPCIKVNGKWYLSSVSAKVVNQEDIIWY